LNFAKIFVFPFNSIVIERLTKVGKKRVVDEMWFGKHETLESTKKGIIAKSENYNESETFEKNEVITTDKLMRESCCCVDGNRHERIEGDKTNLVRKELVANT
jgi:hypothetical protein